MTATDELRRMLDERGVEWRRTPHYSSESIDNETVFRGDGIEWYANDHLNGRLGLRTARYEVTPEQAIAATLGDVDATGERQGVGTCYDVGRYCFTCSECGHTMNEPHHMFNRNDPNVMPNYCPNCGRKVVDE